MNKGLVIGLGYISKENLLKIEKFKYSYCFACGPAINLIKNSQISRKIMFLSEGRLLKDDDWNKISIIRKEAQTYNLEANNAIDLTIPNEIWIHHTKKIFKSQKEIIKILREKGFIGKIFIYNPRMLFLDIYLILGLRGFLIANKLHSLLDVIISIIFNKLCAKFGFKIPSTGTISILACLRKVSKVDILGISLDRKFGYVNGKKFQYPKLGQINHVEFDKEILRVLNSRIFEI